MHGASLEKVEGGKLVRVAIDFDAKISHIAITGDFFLHPEEEISAIEQSLIGQPSGKEPGFYASIIERVVEAKGIQMIGINTEAIARLVVVSMREAAERKAGGKPEGNAEGEHE